MLYWSFFLTPQNLEPLAVQSRRGQLIPWVSFSFGLAVAQCLLSTTAVFTVTVPLLSGMNKNGPYVLRSLNTDPHLVWVDTGGIVLLKEVCYWDELQDFKAMLHSQFNLCFLLIFGNMTPSAPNFQLHLSCLLPAAMLAPAFWDHKPEVNFFFYKLAWSGCIKQ